MATSQTHPVGVPEWTLADRLRKAREITGMKQGPFAAAIGVSPRSVTNYENGKAPKRPVLLSWALACGVPLEWLLTGDVDLTGPPADGEALDRRKTGGDLHKAESTCIHVGAGLRSVGHLAPLPMAA